MILAEFPRQSFTMEIVWILEDIGSSQNRDIVMKWWQEISTRTRF